MICRTMNCMFFPFLCNFGGGLRCHIISCDTQHTIYRNKTILWNMHFFGTLTNSALQARRGAYVQDSVRCEIVVHNKAPCFTSWTSPDSGCIPTFGDMCNGPIGNGGKRARPSARLIIRFLQRDATSNRHDQSQRHVEQTGILQKVERLQLSTRVYSSASVSGVRQNSLVGVMIFCGFCGFWNFRAFGGKKRERCCKL